MEDMKWKTASYGAGLDRVVPKRPGIYAIAKVERYRGLIEGFEYVYLGKSNNLRRRWNEHVDLAEPNPGLLGLGSATGYEFWWAEVPLEALSQVEADLIGHFRPQANRRGKGKPTKKMEGQEGG